MASLRDVRRRIDSIKNTEKITRAMQVVAATKLRRAQAAAQAARPYADKMREVLQTTSERSSEYKHPYLTRRDGKRAVVILVTSDKGLCGALNVNVMRAATRTLIDDYAGQGRYVTIGRKGRESMARFGREILADASGLGDRPSEADILPAVTVALQEYAEDRADVVLLAYSRFISAMRQEPVVRTLIPLEVPEREEGAGPAADYIYEPDPEAVLDSLLPRYIETQVYQAVLENKASFFGAQMVAMQNATKAAGDFIKSLTLTANKVRQAGITAELMEIVSGAEASQTSN